MKYCFGLAAAMLVSTAFVSSAFAWSGGVHDFTCPESALNCRIADDAGFQQENPYLSVYHHLCLDNKPNCLGRVTADYYLKKYYVTGNRDFLGAAAHLYQDAHTPDHWYVSRQLPWKNGELFSPRWASEIEGEAGFIIENQNPDTVYDRVITFQGQEIHINTAYLDYVKTDVASRIAHEPSESLDELEARVLNMRWRARVRSYKDVALALALLSSVLAAVYVLVWAVRRHFRAAAKIGKDFYPLIILASIGIFCLLLVALVY
ncbi:MAG: hypothetical protein ABIG71_01245 [Candidatus Uhrbacteria bacterium]